MTMRWVGLVVVVAGVLGCGGDDSSNDNTSIDDTTISTSMTEGGSSSSASGSETSTTVSTSMTTTEGSSSADSGSSSADSGGSGSSSADSGSTETGSGDPDGVVCFFAPGPCAAGEVCCEDSQSGESSCIGADAQCMGIALVCDGPEDCGGQLCCGTNDGGSECADSCEGYHLCHDEGDCNDGESCCPNGGGA